MSLYVESKLNRTSLELNYFLGNTHHPLFCRSKDADDKYFIYININETARQPVEDE